ncbi:MAG: endonuclease/exonuclease/phosphatase family protein [Bacteroidota bacterium]
MKLRLLSYNIRFGGTGREDGLTASIRAAEPDVVVLQEATRPDVVERVAKRTGMPHWGSLAGHSVGFLSRIEVAASEWRRPRGCSRSLLRLEVAGADLSIYGVHLRAMHSDWSEGRRVRELKAILGDIEPHKARAHLLAGDFNTLAPGEKLDRGRLPLRIRVMTSLLGARVRWRTIQIMLDAGYSDSFRRLHPDDPGYTFPTWSPHLRLDYLFAPESSSLHVDECAVVDGSAARAASDHLPLLAVVSV